MRFHNLIRIQYKKRGRATTKPGTSLKKTYPHQNQPMGRISPRFPRSRHRRSLRWILIWTVRLYDWLRWPCHGLEWTTSRLWKRGSRGSGTNQDIEKSLPFPLLSFDSDNGSEFLNHHLLKHFTQRKHPIQFTHSRAYHKDDNTHVEQKNWTQVRKWLGYQRLDNPEVIPLLNHLYRQEWRLFHNFFYPLTKLLSKERIGSKTIKHHDHPKTP